MATQKRYYWLKLQDGFFTSKRIKKLRRLAGGDTYTIIYLKMQLLAMKTDGILRWTGLENDFASELALDLDEDTENVAVTLQYLLSCGLAETDDNTAFFFPYAVENTGSETSSAARMRENRAQLKLRSEHCATLCAHCDGEIDKEKEQEIEKEKEKKPRKPRKKTEFVPPTVEEVREYANAKNALVDPDYFHEHYTLSEWTDKGGNPIQNWKQVFLNWERREQKNGNAKPVSSTAAESAEAKRARWGIHYDNE